MISWYKYYVLYANKFMHFYCIIVLDTILFSFKQRHKGINIKGVLFENMLTNIGINNI